MYLDRDRLQYLNNHRDSSLKLLKKFNEEIPLLKAEIAYLDKEILFCSGKGYDNAVWSDNPQAEYINICLQHLYNFSFFEQTCFENEVEKEREFSLEDRRIVARRGARQTVRDEKERQIMEELYDTVDNFWSELEGAIKRMIRDAIEALSCRHTVGQNNDWNWEAYDLLTEQWTRVFGKVHPDDQPYKTSSC